MVQHKQQIHMSDLQKYVLSNDDIFNKFNRSLNFLIALIQKRV